MMEPWENICVWEILPGLSNLFSIQGAVVVGAGKGTSEWLKIFQRSDAPVALVEADPSHISMLTSLADSYSGWQVFNTLVYSKNEAATFFSLSNSKENGLLAPDKLASLWPNIELRTEQNIEGVTLDHFVEQFAVPVNWLVVDCFPGIEILEGGRRCLSDIEVVLIRVSLEGKHPPIPNCSFVEIEEFLRKKDFTAVGVEAGRHPANGYGLFIRDYKKIVVSTRQDHVKTVASINQDHVAAMQCLEKDHVAALQCLKKEGEAAHANLLTLESDRKTLESDMAGNMRLIVDQTKQLSKKKNTIRSLSQENKRLIEMLQSVYGSQDVVKRILVEQSRNISSQLAAQQSELAQLILTGSDCETGVSVSATQETFAKESADNEPPRCIERCDSDTPSLGKKLFIDCGGYDGCSVIKFLLLHPDYEVISFEANPVLWEYYRNLPTRLIQMAVADFDGTTDFIIDSLDADGSSLVRGKNIDYTQNIENDECPAIEVECTDLSNFIREQSLHYEIIRLKLDVEGAEYSILKKMLSDGTLSLIEKLYAEFHWHKMGMPEEEHTALLGKVSDITSVEEWDSQEFAVHRRGASASQRRSILESVLKRANK